MLVRGILHLLPAGSGGVGFDARVSAVVGESAVEWEHETLLVQLLDAWEGVLWEQGPEGDHAVRLAVGDQVQLKTDLERLKQELARLPSTHHLEALRAMQVISCQLGLHSYQVGNSNVTARVFHRLHRFHLTH